MKEKIHPKYYPEAVITCSCGNSWTVGATQPKIHTDVCYSCHPFFTGEQRIVDTEGQVERFYKRLQAREQYAEDARARQEAKESPLIPIGELKLRNRVVALLKTAELETVADVLAKLEIGDEALLAIGGIGRTALADIKKALRARGFEWSEAESGDS